MTSYKDLCAQVIMSPESSPRGMRIRETLNASMNFYQGKHLITHPLIPDNREYVGHELNWYIKGDRNDLSITEHATLWHKHVRQGRLNSNYGYWLGPRGNYTLQSAIEILGEDLASRRAIALIGDPDCVSVDEVDVPCTQSIQFLVRNDKLFTIVSMRSQDVWFGLRNDLPFFQLIAEVVSKILGVECQGVTINVASLHAYERQWSILQDLVKHEEVKIVPMEFSGLITRMMHEWDLVP